MSQGSLARTRNKRRHPRKSVELPVMVTDAASGRVAAGIRFSAADLSQSGAFLRSSLLFEIGEELQLEIRLPDGSTLDVRGRVVRVSRARDGDPSTGGMGIEFLDLRDSDRQRVLGFTADGDV